MLFDILWKLARKSLSQTSYNWLSYSIFRRNAQYEKLDTYSSIFNHYLEKGLEFEGRTVIEVGSGLQIFTALYMIRAGAERVFLAEPKMLGKEKALQQFEHFQKETSNSLPSEKILEKIIFYRSLSEIEDFHSGKIDLVCSFTVLEHISDLDAFFSDSYRLLKPGGISYHMVDVSDHTYQFFARFPLLRRLNEKRAIYHLRYSNAMFNWLNDPKCFMNRVLLPGYLEMSVAHGFIIDQLAPIPYKGPCKIHKDVLQPIRSSFDPELLHINAFSMKLRKP